MTEASGGKKEAITRKEGSSLCSSVHLGRKGLDSCGELRESDYHACMPSSFASHACSVSRLGKSASVSAVTLYLPTGATPCDSPP